MSLRRAGGLTSPPAFGSRPPSTIDPAGPVAIVGGGIAGLTAALCFAKAGFSVEVFEQAARLEEAGAGLQLSPNALRVLSLVGVTEQLAETSVAATAVTLRSGRTGRPIAEVPVSSGDGVPYLAVHRADLQAVLLGRVREEPAIALRLGARLTGLASTPQGPIELTFAVGGERPPLTRSAMIVIAADGVHSKVAASLGLPPARASGIIAWRMTTEGTVSARIEAWLGPRRHAVAYPMRGGRRTNLVLITPAAEAVESAEAVRAALLRQFRRWDGRLVGMIEAGDAAGLWPLLTSDRTARPRGPDGLFLIGDAAHTLLPFVAQGAAMAIEDAAVAASCVSRSATLRDAAEGFFDARAARLRQVQDRAHFHRFVYHLSWPFSLGRDLVLASRSRSALARDLAWLYDWQPPRL